MILKSVGGGKGFLLGLVCRRGFCGCIFKEACCWGILMEFCWCGKMGVRSGCQMEFSWGCFEWTLVR